MKFVIVDAGQYAYGESKISPKYINKLKDKYKLEAIEINKYNKELEYIIVTINTIVSLVELQKLVREYCIPYNEETENLIGTKDEVPEFYRYWEN